MQLAPARGGGTATSPRVSSAAAVCRGCANRSRSTREAAASAASASPTRMPITATLLESVPGKSRGAPGASAASTEASTGRGAYSTSMASSASSAM